MSGILILTMALVTLTAGSAGLTVADNSSISMGTDNYVFTHIPEAQVVEVAVYNPLFLADNAWEAPPHEPVVTVNGNPLIMKQAANGIWFGYFVESDAAATLHERVPDAPDDLDPLLDEFEFWTWTSEKKYVLDFGTVASDMGFNNDADTLYEYGFTGNVLANSDLPLSSVVIQAFDFNDDTDIVIRLENTAQIQTITATYKINEGYTVLDNNYSRQDMQDLRDADLTGADLAHADLKGAHLDGADLSYADLSYANLTQADLSWANLTHADLTHADLIIADLKKADLTHADLSGAYLTHANLRMANLFNADINDAYLEYADLSGADLRLADLSYADLTGAYLTQADLSVAYLTHADLTGANLQGAEFIHTDLQNTNLYGSNLKFTNLRHADLTGANLSYADLRGADLTNTTTTSATLTGAIVCEGTQLPGATQVPCSTYERTYGQFTIF